MAVDTGTADVGVALGLRLVGDAAGVLRRPLRFKMRTSCVSVVGGGASDVYASGLVRPVLPEPPAVLVAVE